MYRTGTNLLVHFTGFVDVIRDEGMPIYGSDSYGDLYVEYKVVLPLELSSKMRRGRFLPRPITMNPTLTRVPPELDRAFNGDYSESKQRDEL